MHLRQLHSFKYVWTISESVILPKCNVIEARKQYTSWIKHILSRVSSVLDLSKQVFRLIPSVNTVTQITVNDMYKS